MGKNPTGPHSTPPRIPQAPTPPPPGQRQTIIYPLPASAPKPASPRK